MSELDRRLPLWRGSLYNQRGTGVRRFVPLYRLPETHRQRVCDHGAPAQDGASNPGNDQDIQQTRR